MIHGLRIIISPYILEGALTELDIPPSDDNVAVDSNVSETLVNKDTGIITVRISDTEINRASIFSVVSSL